MTFLTGPARSAEVSQVEESAATYCARPAQRRFLRPPGIPAIQEEREDVDQRGLTWSGKK